MREATNNAAVPALRCRDSAGASLTPTLCLCCPPSPPRPLPFGCAPRQREEACELREEKGADVQLRRESAGVNEANHIGRGDQLHLQAGLRRERGDALAGLDEKRVNPIVKASGTGKGPAQGMNGAREEPCFLQEL